MSKRKSNDEFIREAQSIHHNKYDYSKVEYANNKTKVCIVCPEHGEIIRHHKFGFRKQHLHKQYGLPLTMTEREMTESLGYTRIWDCGLIKYAYRF